MQLLSIIPNMPSFGTSMMAGLLDVIMVLWVLRVRKYPHHLSDNSVIIAVGLSLSHFLFCMYVGDYFSYKKIVEQAGFTDLLYYSTHDFHVEIAYVYIINIVHNNYLLFRIVVWGGAMLLFCLVAMRLKLDKSTFVFYLCIFITPFTSTSRLALALAIAFMGFALIVRPYDKFKLFTRSLGVVLIVISMFFHRSSPFLAAVLPLSLIKFSKIKLYYLVLLLFLFVILTGTGVINYILSMDTTAEDSIFDSQTAQGYLLSEMSFKAKGFGELIRFFFSYLSYALLFFIVIKGLLTGKYNKWPSYIQKFANATFIVISLSFVFLILPGANTYKTFERLIVFSIVPGSMLLAYLLKTGGERKLVNCVNISLTCWVLYNIAYMVYLG